MLQGIQVYTYTHSIYTCDHNTLLLDLIIFLGKNQYLRKAWDFIHLFVKGYMLYSY